MNTSTAQKKINFKINSERNKEYDNRNSIILILILASIFIWLKSLINADTNNTSNENKQPTKQTEDRIPEYTIAPYTKDQYPDVFKKYKKQINRINLLRVQAAKSVVESGKCDVVSLSELNFEKSSKNNFTVFVDCKNKERFYISENDIKKKIKSTSEKEKAWDEKEATFACMDYIRVNAKNPDTVDIHSMGGMNHYTSDTGNVVVYIEFDAKNDFGAKITSIAHCIFPPQKPGQFSISRK